MRLFVLKEKFSKKINEIQQKIRSNESQLNAELGKNDKIDSFVKSIIKMLIRDLEGLTVYKEMLFIAEIFHENSNLLCGFLRFLVFSIFFFFFFFFF